MNARDRIEALYEADLKQIMQDHRLAIAEARRLRDLRLSDLEAGEDPRNEP